MWHSPGSPPLSTTERDRVYGLHVWLQAVKRCDMCNEVLPVADFGDYGVQPCGECQAHCRRIVTQGRVQVYANA